MVLIRIAAISYVGRTDWKRCILNQIWKYRNLIGKYLIIQYAAMIELSNTIKTSEIRCKKQIHMCFDLVIIIENVVLSLYTE